MNTISFDITYKKNTDKDSIRLSSEADFQQLKIMICGRYKLYDMNNIYIYYKGKNIIPEEHSKLKNYFKQKVVQIEVRETPPTIEETPKYFCKCDNPAIYICDACNEFLCIFCYNLKKHITHDNKIIKITKYNNYIKGLLRDNENLINNQIIKDDGYLFFEYFDYDMNNEIKIIDDIYEYAKNYLEEIRKKQINFISEFNKCNKYGELSQKIEEVINQYSSINMDDDDLDNLMEEKNNIIKKTKDLLYYYDQIKIYLLYYTKNIKEIQNFNEGLIHEIKNFYNSTKKKFNNMPKIDFQFESILNSYEKGKEKAKYTKSQTAFKTINLHDYSKTISKTSVSGREKEENSRYNNFRTGHKEKSSNSMSRKNRKLQLKINKDEEIHKLKNEKNGKTRKKNSASKQKPDRVIMRLKDSSKFLIFSIDNLSFKERFFIDRANFTREIASLNDIIQTNHNNICYMLMGKLSNKLFYYDYQVNSVFYGGKTLHSHNYGSMVYCPKTHSLYLLGGNEQKNCEICEIRDVKNLLWKNLPQLNEERQEFGTLCFNNYLYVFFGFNSAKNKHSTTIERLNVDKPFRFETIYSNKSITISSLGCCKFNKNEGREEIMLLGGYDGERFLDTTLIFMINEMKIREGIITIPNLDIHEQFLFYKESGFVEFEPNLQFGFDWKNNVHLLSPDSYELFSEGLY